MNAPNPLQPGAKKTKPQHFSLCCATVYYKRDGAVKERTMNGLLELPTQRITRPALARLQQSMMQRIEAENNVAAEDVQDVVIVSITYLGHMRLEDFHG